MFKGCFGGVPGVLQRCLRHVSEMFQKRFRDCSGMLKGRLDNVLELFLERLKFVSSLKSPQVRLESVSSLSHVSSSS